MQTVNLLGRLALVHARPGNRDEGAWVDIRLVNLDTDHIDHITLTEASWKKLAGAVETALALLERED